MMLADRLHAAVWERVRRTPLGGRLHDDAGLRVGLLGLALVCVCIGATLASPLWLLLIAPIAFGVPHVAADLRFLVLSPPRPLSRALLATLAGLFVAMTAVRLVALWGGPSQPRIELGLGFAAVGVAVAWSRHWPLLAAVVLVGAASLASPRQAGLMVGHAHNFVAVAVWIAWSRGALRIWTVALLAAALAGIATGGLDGWWIRASEGGAAGLTLTGMVGVLAPDLPGPWGLRAVMAFALMQAVHYALWLGAIPLARATELRTPSERWDGWRRDLGPALVGLTIVGTVVLVVWGVARPTVARSSYLGLVLFHGWLELAVLGYLMGRRD